MASDSDEVSIRQYKSPLLTRNEFCHGKLAVFVKMSNIIHDLDWFMIKLLPDQASRYATPALSNCGR